jgi:PKD repeat protein
MSHTIITPRSTIALIVLLFCSFGAMAEPATSPPPCTINGPVISCVNQLEYYYVTPSAGSTYSWSLPFGGSLANTTGPSTMVNWTSNGTYQLMVTETVSGGGSFTCFIQVSVLARPAPKIFTDFISDCQEEEEKGEPGIKAKRPKECWLVCENMTVNYWTTPESGYTYTWTFGGATPSTITGASVSTTWGAPGPGTIILTATSPGGCSESITQCVTIIASPKAAFSFNNQDGNNPLKICKGETVYFNDQSTGASQWLWNFGDNTTSTAQNPVHNYPGPGVYYGSLTVKNNCGCEDVMYFEVYVEDRVSPEIGCISTVCLGECAFYTVTNINNCPNANIKWTIYGGQILGTPVNGSVNVIWDNSDGYLGPNGYGLICARVDNCEELCDNEVCVRVPVIHSAQIIGPTEVCAGDQVTYSVPNQPGINEIGGTPNGVNFEWAVNGGQIISLPPYSNSIVVQWFGSGTVSLNVYENSTTDFGCKISIDPIQVNAKLPFSLSPSESTGCAGQVKTITANGSGTFAWTVIGPGGTAGPVNGGPSFNVTLTQAGSYIVKAQSTSGAYCPITPSAVIMVSPTPATPTGNIQGPTAVCVNTPYTYSMAAPPPPGHIYVWSATNGTVFGAGGQTVSAQWNGTPPMTLSVRVRSNLEPFCESLPLNLPISIYTPPANFINGPNATCINQIESFNASGLINFTNLQWSIVPEIAGSVASGQGTTNITVQINSNAPTSAQIVATATVCGTPVTSIFPITINQIPNISIIAPNSVCGNSPVSLSVSPNTGVVSYLWSFGDGGTSSNATPAHIWNTLGTYPITVQMTLNICGNPTVTATKNIQINTYPIANITASNGYVICPALGLFSTDLTATSQIISNYTWSVPGVTGPVLTVTSPGVYTVTATDPLSGCTDTASRLVIGCPNPCFSNMDPWQFWAFEDCDTYTFVPFPTVADFLFWDFDDGSISYDPGVVSHTFPHAGYYQVTLYSYDPIEQCTLSYVLNTIVKYKGNFQANFNCSSGAMVTTLTDLSEYLLPAFPPSSKTWFDGSVAIGSGDILNTVLTPGPHNIFIQVNIGGMICNSPTQVINVPGMPQASFLSFSPDCQGNAIQFSNTSIGGGLTKFTWNFGDGAQSNLQNPDRVYANSGTYTVSLTVANDWGCSSSTSQVIQVLSRGNNPMLSLTPNPPVCEGNNILITATSGLPLPISYTWFNAANPSVSLQGPSSNPNYTATSNGLYGVRVTDGNNCHYNVLALQPVTITPPPYVNISGNTDACVDGSFVLSADIGVGYSYQWTVQPPAGNSYTHTGPNLTVSASIQGLYIVSVNIVHTASGCSNSGSTILTAHSGITDLTIAQSGNCVPTVLSANGTGIVTYNWSEGGQTQQILATTEGQYAVIASNQWGCTAKAETYVGGPPDMSNVMTGCYELCEGTIWQAPLCNGCTYQWTQNGAPIPGAVDPYHKIGESGVYTVIVTSPEGCTNESGPIDISVVSFDECKSCKIEIGKVRLVCRGYDPQTGQVRYDFWMDVINYGGALYGTTLQTTLGNIYVNYPPDGFIPGGGAVTQMTGYILWNGQADNGCIELLGYLTKDCSEPTPCTAKWCGELPPCCKGECKLEVSKVRAVCLTNGIYRVSGTVSNYGCSLYNLYVETAVGNFPLTPSTLLSGDSYNYSAIVSLLPGTYNFRVCGFDAQGEQCCVESSIRVPRCDIKADCYLGVTTDYFTCVGTTPEGYPIYDFQFSISGVPLGYTPILVSNQIGYISTQSSSCFGSNCTISGTYVDFPESADLCFGVLAQSPDPEPKYCVGIICLERPRCFRKEGGISDRNSGKNMLSRDFNLVPNPAKDVVQVWLPEQSVQEIIMTDMLGKQLNIQSKVTDNVMELNLVGLPSGMYLITVRYQDGSKGSKKLVIEK